MITRGFILLLLVLSIWSAGGAFGQETGSAKAMTPLPKGWEGTLTRAEKSLLRADITDDALDELRAVLVSLQKNARKASDERLPEIETLKAELTTLGPPPTADEPAEPSSVAERRKTVTDRLVAAEGEIKEAGLLVARADQVLERVSSLKRVRFTERIIARGLSPLAPAVWRQAWPELTGHVQAAQASLAQWLQSDSLVSQVQSKGWKIPAGVLTAVLLAWPLRLWLLRRFGYVAVEGEPTYRQRLRVALFTGIVRSLLPTAAVLALYLSLRESDLLSDAVEAVGRVGVFSLVFVFFATAFCWAALAPTAPFWRLVPIGDHAALVISRVVTALAAVFAIDWVLNAIDEQIGASLELVTVQQFLSGLAIAGLLFALLRPRIWQYRDTESRPGISALKLVRLLLAVLVLAIPLTACLGYVALSRLLATQLVQSGGLFALLVLLSELGSELIDQILSRDSRSSLKVRDTLVLTEEGGQLLGFWLKLALRLALILTGIIVLPLIWGVQAEAIATGLSNALTGFQIGPIKISLADLLWAGFLFAALLIATRLLQRALEQQIFPRTRLDIGIRNSIRAAVGYTGFTLAAVLAISTIGIDLSNLALIAGALSVGIGLGLQNIVNNFVSGVILLVERPIKVGDWVVIGDHQGYVRKISVRATELTTFDRGSVFIPNSNLIASPVMNRTYADPLGRVIVPVGLAYGSDTQKVRGILQDIASCHPEILKNPAPLVLFRSFGESALQFELVAYLADVNRSLSITSDLCFAIYEAFSKEGIEFPFPQRDVSLSLHPDQIERLLAAWKPNPLNNVSAQPVAKGYQTPEPALMAAGPPVPPVSRE